MLVIDDEKIYNYKCFDGYKSVWLIKKRGKYWLRL